MKVSWECWPNPISGTQDDPKVSKSYVKDMQEAVELVSKLQKQHGNNLGHVSVTIMLYEGR